jgi:esterase/lipase
MNYFNKHFPEIDTLFYKDTFSSCYHKGIQDISKNIDETVIYLKDKIKGYNNVIFIGNSGGGYGAILFGSLLNVTTVLVFMPPTILYKKDKEEKYRNLAPFINETTNYHIYANLSIKKINDPHHIRHCENINIKPNVKVIKKENFSIKNIKRFWRTNNYY